MGLTLRTFPGVSTGDLGMDVPVAPQTRPYPLAGLARARTIEHSNILEPRSFVWMTEQHWWRKQKHQESVLCVTESCVTYLGEMDMQRFLRNF